MQSCCLQQSRHQLLMETCDQDHAHVYGGLLALRVLARKYEFKQTEQRDVLATIVNATFPQLLAIFQVRLVTDCKHLHGSAFFIRVYD